jgi:hypothetical protein
MEERNGMEWWIGLDSLLLCICFCFRLFAFTLLDQLNAYKKICIYEILPSRYHTACIY